MSLSPQTLIPQTMGLYPSTCLRRGWHLLCIYKEMPGISCTHHLAYRIVPACFTTTKDYWMGRKGAQEQARFRAQCAKMRKQEATVQWKMVAALNKNVSDATTKIKRLLEQQKKPTPQAQDPDRPPTQPPIQSKSASPATPQANDTGRVRITLREWLNFHGRGSL